MKYTFHLVNVGYEFRFTPGRHVLLFKTSSEDFTQMSGVWSFDSDGVYTLIDNPMEETSIPGPAMGHKVLVHKATNTTMTNYEQLTSKLHPLGWYPFAHNEEMRQYHRGAHSLDLLTLPPYFSDLRTTHMYDVVVKTRSAFEVRDVG